MSEDEPPEQPSLRELIASAPGLARLSGQFAWRLSSWAMRSTIQGYLRVIRAALRGESPGDVLNDATATAVSRLVELIESDEGQKMFPAEVQRLADVMKAEDPRPDSPSREELRRLGAALLEQSRDVDYVEQAHPAYRRILDELAPDEGRILRLLNDQGPQPSVDVRTSSPLPTNSELVEPGLNMIGAFAGVKHVEKVRPYLNNLYRLGLVWFSREPVDDLTRYQILEAQPDVQEAMERAGRAKTVRRSIHLTPFGEDFCSTCLPDHDGFKPRSV